MSKPSVMTLALLMGLSTTGCFTGLYYENKALSGDLEALEKFTTETYNTAWWNGQRSIREFLRASNVSLEVRQKALELTKLDSEEGMCSVIWVANNPNTPEALRLQALKRMMDNADNGNVKRFFSARRVSFRDGQNHYSTCLNDKTVGFFLKNISNLDSITQIVEAEKKGELDKKLIQEGLANLTDKELLQIIKKLAEKYPYEIRFSTQTVSACLKSDTAIATYVVLYGDKESNLNMDVVAKITSQALLSKLMLNPKIDKALHKTFFAKLTEQEPLITLAKNETMDVVFRRAAVLKIEDAATKSELAKTVFPAFYNGCPGADENGSYISEGNRASYMMDLAKLIQDEDFLCDAGAVFDEKEKEAILSNDKERNREMKTELWNLVSPETWTCKLKEKQLKHEGQLLFALSKVTDPALLQAIVDDASYSETVRNKAGNQLCDWKTIQKEVFELPKDVLAKEAAEVEARGKKVAEAANMFVINGLYLGMPVRDYYVLSYARNVGMDIHCYWDNEDKIARIDELRIKRGNVYAATGIEPNDMYGHLRFGSDLASFRSAKTTSEDAARVFELRMWGQHAVEDTWQASSTRR